LLKSDLALKSRHTSAAWHNCESGPFN
jgi:hypothetical protein